MRLRAVFVAMAAGVAVNAIELKPMLDQSEANHHSDHLGFFKLPQFPQHHYPSYCLKFDDICALEAASKHEQAYTEYENRFGECGLAGWNKLGHLGSGHSAVVALRRNPCGNNVAMKVSHSENHIKHDCNILHELVPFLDSSDCDRCFPEFYYYSNMTGVCYSEHVPSVPIEVFFDHVNANKPSGFQHVRKAWLEGMGALAVLQRLEIVHRDLNFRNIVVRLPDHNNSKSKDVYQQYNVVILDFGASVSPKHASVSSVNPKYLGSQGFGNVRAHACAYLRYFYPNAYKCNIFREDVPESGEEGSFLRFLTDLIRVSQDVGFVPDFPALIAQFAAVSRL